MLEKFGILKKNLNIEKKYGPYWKFVMNLASIIPVEYLNDGPIRKIDNPEIVNPIKVNVSSLNFKVTMDGMELKKPYLFPTLNILKVGNFTVLPFNDSVIASNNTEKGILCRLHV